MSPKTVDYDQRVFEISALNALRACLSDTENEVETNFGLFTNTLNNFLREDRVKTEFRQAIIIAQQAYNRLHETVSRRIPLLEKSKADLEKKVNSIEPEFERMQEQKIVIQSTVEDCFASYEQKLVQRINNDIKARKAELANLVEQQEMSDRDRALEIERLQSLDEAVLSTYQEIESVISNQHRY